MDGMVNEDVRGGLEQGRGFSFVCVEAVPCLLFLDFVGLFLLDSTH